MRFHHIGIACANIEEIRQYVEQLYDVADVSKTVYDELQEAEVCMVTMRDGVRVELVSGKMVEKMVKKRQFLYHTCYSTKDIEKKLEEFERMGGKIISEPKPAVLFGEKRVAFLVTELGMIELLEDEEVKKE